MMGVNWTARTGKPITIYGPTGTKALVDGALRYMAGPEALFAAQIPPGPHMSETVYAKEILGDGPVVVFQDDRVKITAVRNTHYATIDGDRLLQGAASYSFRFDAPDRSIVFTGDSGPSDDIVQLARGADILVSEVIDLPGSIRSLSNQYHMPPEAMKTLADRFKMEHLEPEEIGKIAARAGVRMVVLSHVVPGLDTETDMRVYSDGVRRQFKGPVVVGQDLSEF